MHRRELLIGAAYLTLGLSEAHATIIVDHLPWTPNAGSPPSVALPGPWMFFTGDEGRAMEALADRIIPPDQQTPGGKDSGSAIFIDRQLAGPYGRQDGFYIRPPFMKGTKSQGHQSERGPAREYREGLAALDRACEGRRFRPPGVHADRARTVSCGSVRLRELPHCTRQQPAVCRRPRDRNALRQYRGTEHYAGS